MKRFSIILWEISGFAVVSLLGTLSHFLYEITGSRFAALFSSVNESTWEHMKLLFFPMLLFAVVQSFFIGRIYGNFWCIKLISILLGLILIPIIFYTLQGILGKTPDWVNIAIFFVSAAIAFIYETVMLLKGSKPCKSGLAVSALIIIAALFFIFTFNPPEIPLFIDSVSGKLGI